mmetsp:Transcript_11805/g.30321  ORF Transcript_11805/g.30321 Transcript_11805/m.30321 type:complete len:268 (-) Transcript_11805:979-1782(-)
MVAPYVSLTKKMACRRSHLNMPFRTKISEISPYIGSAIESRPSSSTALSNASPGSPASAPSTVIGLCLRDECGDVDAEPRLELWRLRARSSARGTGLRKVKRASLSFITVSSSRFRRYASSIPAAGICAGDVFGLLTMGKRDHRLLLSFHGGFAESEVDSGTNSAWSAENSASVRVVVHCLRSPPLPCTVTVTKRSTTKCPSPGEALPAAALGVAAPPAPAVDGLCPEKGCSSSTDVTSIFHWLKSVHQSSSAKDASPSTAARWPRS